jgi:glycerophosphoryl diester phosphodiesterase
MGVVGKQGFDRPKSSGLLILGHRGMGVGPGENTLGSLAEAVGVGADGVELDVRRTADGALALHHDAVIEGLGPVAELTVDRLPEQVGLLGPALDLLAGHLVNIEIKNLATEPGYDPGELVASQVVGLLAERSYRDNVIVSSFSPATLEAVRRAEPEIPVGLLTAAAHDQDRALARVLDRGWSALHPHHTAVTADLVARAHARGVAVNTWTVNDPQAVLRLRDLGVDALITDRLLDAMDALGEDQEETPPGG